MKQRINVLTIGVNDLEKSLKFYRNGMGLQTQGIIGTEFEHGAVGVEYLFSFRILCAGSFSKFLAKKGNFQSISHSYPLQNIISIPLAPNLRGKLFF